MDQRARGPLNSIIRVIGSLILAVVIVAGSMSLLPVPEDSLIVDSVGWVAIFALTIGFLVITK